MELTPKQKALELAEKMAIYHWTNVCNYEEAKQCALIAVDEIQKLPNMEYDNNKDESQYDYWQEVKEELLNMK